jgi:hypothetical protein
MDAFVRFVDLPRMHVERARPKFDELLQSHPGQAEAIRQALDELEREFPAKA